jgi:hypothetical protein
MFARKLIGVAVLVFSLPTLSVPAIAQQRAGSEVSSYTMGSSVFELYVKSECAEGRPDAVDRALRQALSGADLLPDRASEMRRGIRDAHAVLVAKGGCAGLSGEELARIRRSQTERTTEIRESGGESELDLPSALGGKVAGRASYATVAVEGVPFSVLCLESSPGVTPVVSLALLSPSESMLQQGRRDLADLRGVARLTVSGSQTDTGLQYGMLGISEPDGELIRGSFTGFLRAGMQMFSASFTAVPSEDPCGIKTQAANRP